MRRRRPMTGTETSSAGSSRAAFVGLVLLFLANLFLADDIPMNLLTLVICSIGGVGGCILIY